MSQSLLPCRTMSRGRRVQFGGTAWGSMVVCLGWPPGPLRSSYKMYATAQEKPHKDKVMAWGSSVHKVGQDGTSAGRRAYIQRVTDATGAEQRDCQATHSVLHLRSKRAVSEEEEAWTESGQETNDATTQRQWHAPALRVQCDFRPRPKYATNTHLAIFAVFVL